MTEPTDEAIRAEAEKRWPGWVNGTVPMERDLEERRELLRDGFEDGARWAREQAAPTIACVCGSPNTLGTVHRADGPCYVAEAPTVAPGVEAMARVIWETSRADEGTISVTGAQIVARAVAAADPRRTEAEVAAEAWERGRDDERYTRADRFPVNPYRERVGGTEKETDR